VNGFRLHLTREQADLATARALARPDRDTRTAEQFAADLERETDRSLATDPQRWPWRYTRFSKTPP
jgi:hypothetical protein